MGHNKSADAHLQSRGVNCPSCAGKASLKEKQRAQGKPGARCTRSRVCSVESTRVSHHRFTGTPGLPRAMVLTVSFVLSPDLHLRKIRIFLRKGLDTAGRQIAQVICPSRLGKNSVFGRLMYDSVYDESCIQDRREP